MKQTYSFDLYAKSLNEVIKVFGEDIKIVGVSLHLYNVTLVKEVNPEYEEKMRARPLEGN
jgi:hypothetical protein